MDEPKYTSPLGPRNGHRELTAWSLVGLKASQDFFVSFVLIPFENGRQPPPARSRVAGTDVAAEAGGGDTSPRWPAEGQKLCRALWPKTKSEAKRKSQDLRDDLSQFPLFRKVK